MNTKREQCLLIYGDNPDTFNSNLYTLGTCAPDISPVVVVPQEELIANPQLKNDILVTYRYFCYKIGKYTQKNLSFPIIFIELPLLDDFKNFEELSHCHSILVSPEEFDIRHSEIDEIRLSDRQQAILDTLIDKCQLSIQEELLALSLIQNISKTNRLAAPPHLEFLKVCVQKFLTTDNSEIEILWGSEIGALYRYLQDAMLWKTYGFNMERNLLNELLQTLIEFPTHWGAHLSLLLFKRVYDNFSEIKQKMPLSIQKSVTYYFSIYQKYLQILPPVTNFEVTIIVPTANRLSKLKNALKSIKEQTYSSLRCIISDWGSTDETEEFCQELSRQDSRFTYFRKNIPPGMACCYEILALALDMAQTELVVNLADDDILFPHALKQTVQFFKNYPWVGMVGGGYYKIYLSKLTQTDLPLQQHGPYYTQDQIADPIQELQRCGFDNPIFGGGALYRKSILKEFAQYELADFSAKYAANDWLTTWKCLINYEVGMLQSHMVVYFIYPTGKQLRHSPLLLQSYIQLAEYMLLDYPLLVGEPYPSIPLNHFVNKIVRSYLLNASNMPWTDSAGAQIPDDIDPELQQLWQRYIHICKQISDLSQSCIHENNYLNIHQNQVNTSPQDQKWLLEYMASFIP